MPPQKPLVLLYHLESYFRDLGGEEAAALPRHSELGFCTEWRPATSKLNLSSFKVLDKTYQSVDERTQMEINHSCIEYGFLTALRERMREHSIAEINKEWLLYFNVFGPHEFQDIVEFQHGQQRLRAAS